MGSHADITLTSLEMDVLKSVPHPRQVRAAYKKSKIGGMKSRPGKRLSPETEMSQLVVEKSVLVYLESHSWLAMEAGRLSGWIANYN